MTCPQLASLRNYHGCGKEEHLIKDCPCSRGTMARLTTQSQFQQKKGGDKPQASGRVYAITGVEVVGSGNVTVGYCVIVDRSLCSLYDFGATHFFVLES